MRKITLSLLLLLAFSFMGTAQDINFDPDDNTNYGPWLGFMNVSNLPPPDGDGAFQFPSGWGIPDLVVENNGNGTVSLKPNVINDQDPYWQSTPIMLRGNKIMDANYYKQSVDLNGQVFTFNGSVDMNTLNNSGLGTYDFTVTAFIKVFAPDFSSVLESDIIDLRATNGDFSLSMDATGYPDTGDEMTRANIQFGFQFIGPNIGNDGAMPNGFQAQYDALGSIVVGPNQTLSVEEFEASKIKAFPNPTNNIWTIQAQSNIDNIQVFDVVGKQVMSFTPNSLSADIDSSGLNNGIYLARISAGDRSSTIKLIKE